MTSAAVSGLLATLPMTVWMLGAQRFLLPSRERFALPPEQITDHIARAAGIRSVADQPVARRTLTLINHFAYGAAAGTLYAPLRRAPGAVVVKGSALGLGVWAANYLGLLPVTGVLSNAVHHPARRNALMVVAHLIWGVGTAVMAEHLAQEEQRSVGRTAGL
ncbi:DUF1440 domain-containing protein [Deinococcus sp. QL22]|uniref:DUF1440 domain-containing protein n=1 Tax=Deinococcus sp. QL22 TaxID=2939437 RepID=UPI002016EA3C|nr:DUF1440 domain-containing protein [Deinococcus sp. QL22]UQN08389.1 DUF1440 domain-containing protein [Deinococcus sp. QL22]